MKNNFLGAAIRQQLSVLLVTAMCIGVLGVQSVYANSGKPSSQPQRTGWPVSLQFIKAFDRYCTARMNGNPLKLSAVMTAASNGSLTNARPNNYEMSLMDFTIAHSGGYWYIEQVYPFPNGMTYYFEIPDLTSVSNMYLDVFGPPFLN